MMAMGKDSGLRCHVALTGVPANIDMHTHHAAKLFIFAVDEGYLMQSWSKIYKTVITDKEYTKSKISGKRN